MPHDLDSIAFWISRFVTGTGLGRFSASSGASGAPGAPRSAWQPDPSITDAAIEAELRAGRQIEAIKLHRQRHGSGLQEARQAVVAMHAAGPHSRQR